MAKTRKAGPRREQILRAAEKIFAEKGFQETTISDIAKGAGLSEPTLYEYFSSKEEILFTIPEETSCKLGELIGFHLKMAKGTAARLRAMIYILFWIHQTNPHYAAVSYLILKQSGRFSKSPSYEALRRRLRPLIDVVEEGIAAGEIRSGFTPFFIRSVILGTIEHLTTRKLLLGTGDDLLDYVDPLMELIMGGIAPDHLPGALQLKVTIEPQVAAQPSDIEGV
ncbi:MAG: TetR/AcrR family transcriptional regulator [Desulfobacterales bacterium]|nr:TetR/AcrR family transcriptional regulator [Desulfobacterales bacterium]